MYLHFSSSFSFSVFQASMGSYANMDCRFKKVHLDCEVCKMKLFEVLGSFGERWSVCIDREQKTASVCGEVDANRVMRALGKSCDHAELVTAQFQHPALRFQSNYEEPSLSYGTRQYYDQLPDEDYYKYPRDSRGGQEYSYSYDEEYYYYNNPRIRQVCIYPNGYDPPGRYNNIPCAPQYPPVYDPNDNYESISLCSIM